MKYESTSCLLCHSNNSKPLYAFGEYHVVKCEQCDFGYLSPRLSEEEIKKLYSSNYYTNEDSRDLGYQNYKDMEVSLKKTFARRLSLIEPFLKNKRNVLDVGCAYGYALDLLKDKFTALFGSDFSKEAILELQKKNYEAYWGDILHSPWPNQHFDLILAYEVLEHVYNPRKFVQKLSDLLQPEGILVFVNPNINSILSKLSGRGWVSYKIPEHVGYFTQKSMKKILSENNLTMEYFGSDYQYASLNLIFDRLAKAFFPFKIFYTLFKKFIPSLDIEVPNGNMFVIARKNS